MGVTYSSRIDKAKTEEIIILFEHYERCSKKNIC